MDTEHAAEDWFTFGCDEWFEPVSSVAPSLLENLGEWASRFQRAARVVDVGQAIEGFPSLLDMERLVTLAGCLTSNWDRRTGAHLMEVFYKLSEHSKALTQAADAWTYQQLPIGSKPAEEWGTHQGIAAESEPRELTQNEPIVLECGAPRNRPTVPICAAEYLKNPALAADDIRDGLGVFDQDWGATLVGTDCDKMVAWRFAKKKGLRNVNESFVSDRLNFIAQCVALVSKRKPDLFGRLASALSETSWGTNLEAFLTAANPKGEETFYLDDHPFGELMGSLYDFSDILEFERLTKPDIEAHSKRKPTPKVNAKGSQTQKLVAYLGLHHQYENGVIGNYHPAESADIAKKSKAKPNTVSDFLKREFQSSGSPRDGYVAACKSEAKLLHWLMTKHGDSLANRTADLNEYDEDTIRDRW